jgi:hypothetical protein
MPSAAPNMSSEEVRRLCRGSRELLDSIPLVKKMGWSRGKGQAESPDVVRGRVARRALIAVMVYSFARIKAAVEMKVRDYFVQGRRGCVRLPREGRQGVRSALPPQPGNVSR